jgi:raffinose/stachyose/melibiose transport system substrate-binding protein
MKKFTLVTASLAACALTLAGCQKKAESAPAVQAPQNVNISVLNYLDLTGANSADTIKTIWGGFQAAYPHIIVAREDLYNVPFNQKMAAYSSQGDLPDVMFCWPAGLSAFVEDAGQLKDVTALIKRDGLDKILIPAAQNVQAIEGGKQYMIPQTITSSTAFFYNTATLAKYGLKPAATYAELVQQVKTLKAAGMNVPVAMDNKDDWVMESCLYSLVAGRFAGATWSSDLLSGKLKWTDPAMLKGFQFIKQAYDDGVIPRDSLNSTYGTSHQLFATGQSAYLIDGDWTAGAFATDITTGQALIPVAQQKDVVITVFPAIDGEVVHNSAATVLGTGYGMSASLQDGTPECEAAWTLMKYLVGKDVQTYEMKTGSIGTPVNTQVDLASLNLEPILQARADFDAACGGKYPATPVEDDKFSGDTNNVVRNALQQLGLGSMTPEQAAEATEKVFEAQYKH